MRSTDLPAVICTYAAPIDLLSPAPSHHRPAIQCTRCFMPASAPAQIRPACRRLHLCRSDQPAVICNCTSPGGLLSPATAKHWRPDLACNCTAPAVLPSPATAQHQSAYRRLHLKHRPASGLPRLQLSSTASPATKQHRPAYRQLQLHSSVRPAVACNCAALTVLPSPATAQHRPDFCRQQLRNTGGLLLSATAQHWASGRHLQQRAVLPAVVCTCVAPVGLPSPATVQHRPACCRLQLSSTGLPAVACTVVLCCLSSLATAQRLAACCRLQLRSTGRPAIDCNCAAVSGLPSPATVQHQRPALACN